MQHSKHVVFVETNGSGVLGIETALCMGHKVSFIYSNSNKELYNFRSLEKLFPKLLKIEICEDTFNPESLLESVRSINEVQKIDAVITVLEYCVEATAYVSEMLGLRGNSTLVAKRARDKTAVRKLLQDAGLASCQSFHADSFTSLNSGLASLQYPVVTKPSRGAASFFVRVCKNREEVIHAWDEFCSLKKETLGKLDSVISESLLVEEYLKGRMLSAEVGISNDTFRLFTIGERKRALHNEVIELGTTMPAPLSEIEWSAVKTYAEKVVRALELNSGIFHLEIMLTEQGPILIEMNPRLMGGSLPKVYNFAYGTNIYERLVEAHLNEDFGEAVEEPQDSVTSRIFGSLQDGYLPESFDMSWASEFAENELQFDLYCEPSQRMRYLNSNHDYLGALRLRAENSQESIRIADLAIERLEKALGTKLAK